MSTKARRSPAPATKAKPFFARPPEMELESGEIIAAKSELIERFRQSQEIPDLPLIVIDGIPTTRRVHISVISNMWKGMTITDRRQIIADAFKEAFPGEDAVVDFPLGLTPAEALSQGYLGYQISALVQPRDGVSAAAIRQAMNSAGGVPVRVGDDLQLRFATRGQAVQAYSRLVKQINKPIWMLSEETSTSDSGD